MTMFLFGADDPLEDFDTVAIMLTALETQRPRLWGAGRAVLLSFASDTAHSWQYMIIVPHN